MRVIRTIRERLAAAGLRKKIVIGIIIVAGVIAAVFFTLLAVQAAKDAALRSKADAAAKTYTDSLKTFITTSLKDAVKNGEMDDRIIVQKDFDSRPEPPASLDEVQPKEERLALHAPHPLPFAVSLKNVSALTPPKLEVVPGVGDLSSEYQKAQQMEKDFKKLYTGVIDLYTAHNVVQQLQDNISAYSDEILDEVFSIDSQNRQDVIRTYKVQLPIVEKYYAKMVNDETRRYVKSSYLRVLDKHLSNEIRQCKIVIAELEAGRASDEFRKAVLSGNNSHKEIVAMNLAMAIGGLGVNKPSASLKINAFAKEYYGIPELIS